MCIKWLIILNSTQKYYKQLEILQKHRIKAMQSKFYEGLEVPEYIGQKDAN